MEISQKTHFYLCGFGDHCHCSDEFRLDRAISRIRVSLADRSKYWTIYTISRNRDFKFLGDHKRGIFSSACGTNGTHFSLSCSIVHREYHWNYNCTRSSHFLAKPPEKINFHWIWNVSYWIDWIGNYVC